MRWKLIHNEEIKEALLKGSSYSHPTLRCSVSIILPDHDVDLHSIWFYWGALHKKCLFDESLVIPLEELRIDDKLYFVKESVEVMDREIKQLKRSRIPIIKCGSSYEPSKLQRLCSRLPGDPLGALVTLLRLSIHGRPPGPGHRRSGRWWAAVGDGLRGVTRIVEENLHIRFSESTSNVVGTQSNDFAGTKASDNAGQARKETEPVKDYILLPLWIDDPPFSQDPKSSYDDGVGICPINAVGIEVNVVGGKTGIELLYDPNMPALEDYSIFDFLSNGEDDGAEADMNNLYTTIQVSHILTTRIHKDHPLDQVIEDLHLATQTRRMSKNLEEHGFCQIDDGKAFWNGIGVNTGDSKLMLLGIHLLLLSYYCWVQVNVVEDFLNAHPIKYALTINPTIYTSCIEQFWSTVKAKPINGEVQLHALVDGKKIIITESSVRRDLKLEYKEGKGFSGRVTPLFLIMVVQNQAELGKGSAILTDPHHTPTIIQPSPQPQKTQKPRKPKRKDTQIPQPNDPTDNVADEAVYKELGDSLVRAATIASSLEAEQDSGGGPRGNILQSDEDRLKLNELMELCTNLQNRVLNLEKTKTTQANEIASLKRRVKKLEEKKRSRTHELKKVYKVGATARVESSKDEESLGKDASKQGRINAIDADDDITLVSVQDDADKEIFDVDALNGEEVFVAGQNENVVKEVVDAT
ncbi:hypothetical protein Tco_1215825 [Tanacetum coccineum]